MRIHRSSNWMNPPCSAWTASRAMTWWKAAPVSPPAPALRSAGPKAAAPAFSWAAATAPTTKTPSAPPYRTARPAPFTTPPAWRPPPQTGWFKAASHRRTVSAAGATPPLTDPATSGAPRPRWTDAGAGATSPASATSSIGPIRCQGRSIGTMNSSSWRVSSSSTATGAWP